MPATKTEVELLTDIRDLLREMLVELQELRGHSEPCMVLCPRFEGTITTPGSAKWRCFRARGHLGPDHQAFNGQVWKRSDIEIDQLLGVR